MRSMFAILSALSALVVLTSAHPTSSGFVDIKPRCESCADACPKTHFYYSRKKCCLPTGGPATPVAAPATISCPSKWWYHPTQKCCVPKLPTDATANPTCSSTTFSHWNPTSQCCEKPTPAPVVNTNCEKNHFFYGPKSCCLPTGGPTKLPPTPGSLGCPATWYYHSGKKCCVPKYPNPSPKPTCSSSTYPKWNPGRHCCENPTPVTPGRPQVSNLKRHAARSVSQHKAKKNRTIAAEVPSCPSPMEVCPIAGAAFDQYECIDPVADVRACGGCPALGRGDDCTQILNSLNVSCRQSTSLTVSSCYVESCHAGFVPSKDHGSCVPLLQTSPQ